MLPRTYRHILARGNNVSIAPSVISCVAIQTRLASVQKAAFTRVTKNKKRDEKPDKALPAFTPLPENQVAAFGGDASALEQLPTVTPGPYNKKNNQKAIRFRWEDPKWMKTFGLPRNIFVDFRILTLPCSVSRRITQSVAQRLDSTNGSSRDNRLVMTGPGGCGKSYVMLQMVCHALVNNWIVLYIPRAHKLVDSSTSYAYDSRTQTYLQPAASNQLLQRFLNVNRTLLEDLKLIQEVTFERRPDVPAGEPLRTLFSIAATEQYLAPTILSVVLEELGRQTKHRVLLAVDEFQALFCKTEYRNQQFEHVKSYHLSLPRLLMEYGSGKREFNNGVFLGAVSSSLTQYPITPEFEYAIIQDKPIETYQKLRKGMLEYLQGLEHVRVPGKLEYAEAAAMFEIWKNDRALHTNSYDELFLSKYSESAGNARDFVHGGLLAAQIA